MFNTCNIIFLFFVLLTLSILSITSCCKCDAFSKAKVNDLTKQASGAEDKTKTKEEEQKEDALSEEKEEKIDPVRNYKLVGVYFVNKEPRIIIKNSSNPELGTVELKEGEYLDENESIVVSKIYFSPTVKVELTDGDGYSYVMKPQTTVDKSGSASGSKGTYSRSVPSHFTGSQPKSRFNKKPETAPTQGNTEADNSQPKKKEETPEQEAQAKVTGDQTQAPSQESTTGTQTNPSSQAGVQVQDKVPPQTQVPPPSTTVTPDAIKGVDTRPKNPFGE